MLITDAIKYREELVKYARNMVGDEAEDIVQDMLAYWFTCRMPSSPTPIALLRWYVKNKCIDYIRKRDKDKKAIDEIKFLEANDIYKDRFSPPKQENEHIDKVLDLLQEIDPFARQLFILNKVMGVTMVEIAKETGIKKARLFYIQEKTIKILKNVRD